MTKLLFRDDGYLRSCTASVVEADARGIRLNRTVFYPMGGGQPGDTGALRLPSGQSIIIVDTIKGALPEEVVHVPAPGSALPKAGTELGAEIDWERRYRLMRMHTCLHLLCSIVPGAVTGGQVSDGKGRLDFDVPGSSLDKGEIADRLNALIAESRPVGPRWIPTTSSPPSLSSSARCRSSRRAHGPGAADRNFGGRSAALRRHAYSAPPPRSVRSPSPKSRTRASRTAV